MKQCKNREFLQKRLPKLATKKNIKLMSKKFCNYIGNGNLSFAIKLRLKDTGEVILPSNKEIINVLKLKHPQGRKANEDT